MNNKEPVNIAFFDSKPYDIAFFTEANKNFLYNIEFLEPNLNRKTAVLAKGAQVVCAFVNDKLDKETLDILYNEGIRLVVMRCAGYNNVDLEAAYGKITILRVPAYSPYSVAEFALAALLALTRKIPQAFNRTRNGNFQLSGLTGRDLHGRVCGVIGTGKIGKIFAELMKGFGMEILLYDKFPDQAWAKEKGFRYTDLDELFTKSDFISLHCPLTPESRHIINGDSLKKMKNDCVLINTGRGALIDAKALVEALKDKQIGGAALDVYEEEEEYFYEDWSTEVIKDDVLARLLMMPNVLISSHQAFLTTEALTAIANTTLNNVKAYIEGKPLENQVCFKCSNN